MRSVDEIAQELDDIQEKLCELYSKRRSLEKEYQTAVIRTGLTTEFDRYSVHS